MVDPHAFDASGPFEGSSRPDELLAYGLHVDPRIEPRRIYRLRATNQESWLFHGKPMRLLEVRPSAYCYRMKFDLTPEEITDPLDARCRCVYTDNWHPAALALTLVPTEWARRMMHMMALKGLDPGLVTDDASERDASIETARKRCQACPAESFCDEWLTETTRGPDTFCPNAPTFDRLARRSTDEGKG